MNEPQQPTEEQLLEALKQIKTEDVVLQTVATLVNLAGQKLSVEGAKDPVEAQRAIDAAKQMLPLVPEEAVGPIQNALDQVQMLFAKESQQPPSEKPPEKPPPLEDLDARLVIGVFGGSGFYRFLDDMTEVPVATPYGPPSAPVRVGTIEGTEVAFMPRHGDEHTLPPHRINYRANIWAMKEVGVDRIVGPSACGSLKPELEPGTFVLCDQFVDRTAARESTFYDGPQTTHVSAADPYCPDLRGVLAEAAREEGIPVVEGGTVVVIEGPRFSTRAESRWYADSGFDVINMTQYPECWLARELELCYANISLVTDYDVGLKDRPDVPPVSADMAFGAFAENLDRLRALLFRAVPKIGPQPDDICATALDSAIVHH